MFEDYADQSKFLERIQPEALSKRVRRFLMVLSAIGLGSAVLGSAEREQEIENNEIAPLISAVEAKPQTETPSQAEPIENEIREAKKLKKSDEQVIEDLIQKQYDYYNKETSEFYLTFKNDKGGKIRKQIEGLGLKYGNPENIDTYKAIAAVESRYIWSRSPDGGVGYFQITNIPEKVAKRAERIAKKNHYSKEEKNIIEGILNYEYCAQYIKKTYPNESKEVQKYLAEWMYNAGDIFGNRSIQENLDLYKEIHRTYGAKVGAYEKAIKEGYRH